MFTAALSTMKEMRIKALAVAVFSLAALAPAGCSPAVSLDNNGDGRPDQWYEVEGEQVRAVSMDRNYDGKVDYTAEYDSEQRKVREELDFNFDGRMDDFYYFENGVLVREEIDTNFDGRVDLWVLLQGSEIHGYRMDRDFDGVAEVVKDYGP
jgi:hypothetical protein